MRGDRRHRVTVQNPDPPIPDGDGGSQPTTWHDADPPTLWVAMTESAAQTMEQARQGAVVGLATHRLESAFHPEVTTQSRILHDATVCACGRVPTPVQFSVLSVASPDARGIAMSLQVAEVVP